MLNDAELLHLLGDLLLLPDEIVFVVTVLTHIEDTCWQRAVLLLYRARAASVLVEVMPVVKDAPFSLLRLEPIDLADVSFIQHLQHVHVLAAGFSLQLFLAALRDARGSFKLVGFMFRIANLSSSMLALLHHICCC